MGYVLIGIAVLAILWIASNQFVRANPTVLARRIRLTGGALALAGGIALFYRGSGILGSLLMMLGLALLSGRNFGPFSGGAWGGGTPSAGGGSRVTTDHLDMELDHDSGAIRGRVVKGIFKGRSIESLSPADLALLWQDCRFTDSQSAQILEAYLDRVHPEWREDVIRGEQELAGGPDGRMTREQAFEILGLPPGASEDDIRKAHRDLMKKMHPDQGGSNYLAAKINEAKDVLLG
jgi:DnaJ domain